MVTSRAAPASSRGLSAAVVSVIVIFCAIYTTAAFGLLEELELTVCLSHRVSLTVSPVTVCPSPLSPTVYLTVSPNVSPTVSLTVSPTAGARCVAPGHPHHAHGLRARRVRGLRAA